MIIELNGNPHEVNDGATLAKLIESVQGSSRGSAIVVDGTVVPRSEWGTTELEPSQTIELITAVQGG